MEWFNIGLGFLEGFALIISPCILPILPIILAGSLTGSKRRPLGIILGFVIVFALFTFFSRALVQALHLDLTLVRQASYVILILLGVIMMSATLSNKFGLFTQGIANTGMKFSSANDAQGGLVSGVLFGGLIALVWTPCAGPILAAVIVQSVIQETNAQGFLIVMAFAIGAAIPMLLIALLGRRAMGKFGYFKAHASLFRKLLGVVIIVSVAYLYYLESAVGASIPDIKQSNGRITALENALPSPYRAPAIGADNIWINSPALQLSKLKGNVVLIDFWTYSCINCIRTLPYIKSWYHKYHDKGLVIIGIHAPEFAFERIEANVKEAVSRLGIQYPVAMDNQFTTWRNYNNKYWPAHYLIDKNGDVVYTHFGEGRYDVTENNIRFLLGMKDVVEDNNAQQTPRVTSLTPEIYLGYARAEHFASKETVINNGSSTYSFPEKFTRDQWALSGKWIVFADRVIADEAGASIKLNFHASKVFVVMGNATSRPMQVRLQLDDKNVVADKGKDVEQSIVTVESHGLYELIALPETAEHVLQLTALNPGLEVYTFTFG